MSGPYDMLRPDAGRGAGQPRIVPIKCDGMEPTLRRGDVALAVPADAFVYDGLYLLELLPGGMEVLRCQHVGRRRIRVARDNPAYGTASVLAVADFDRMVVGRIAAFGRPIDAALLHDAGGWSA